MSEKKRETQFKKHKAAINAGVPRCSTPGCNLSAIATTTTCSKCSSKCATCLQPVGLNGRQRKGSCGKPHWFCNKHADGPRTCLRCTKP